MQYNVAAAEALERAGGVCEMCGSMRPDRTNPPFREYPDDLAIAKQYLIAVCRPCFVMCWALRRRRLEWWARVTVKKPNNERKRRKLTLHDYVTYLCIFLVSLVILVSLFLLINGFVGDDLILWILD